MQAILCAKPFLLHLPVCIHIPAAKCHIHLFIKRLNRRILNVVSADLFIYRIDRKHIELCLRELLNQFLIIGDIGIHIFEVVHAECQHDLHIWIRLQIIAQLYACRAFQPRVSLAALCDVQCIGRGNRTLHADHPGIADEDIVTIEYLDNILAAGIQVIAILYRIRHPCAVCTDIIFIIIYPRLCNDRTIFSNVIVLSVPFDPLVLRADTILIEVVIPAALFEMDSARTPFALK